MKNQIQRIVMMIIFTMCVSLTVTAQIKIGGAMRSDAIKPALDFTTPLPPEGNAISGQIEFKKEFLNRAYSVAEIRRALTLGATVTDGSEQAPPPGGIFPTQPTKAVGRLRSLRVKESTEAFTAEYTLDQLPSDLRITAWVKFDYALVKSCGGSSGVSPTTLLTFITGRSSTWNGTVSFKTSTTSAPMAGSRNFALFRSCIK